MSQEIKDQLAREVRRALSISFADAVKKIACEKLQAELAKAKADYEQKIRDLISNPEPTKEAKK